jgi:hypothetical protein
VWREIGKDDRLFIGFALLIITFYLSPLIILGEDAHIRVHDNLDSNLAWYKVLAQSGEIFGEVEARIPQIINGLPRNAFGSEFTGIVWLYAMLPTMVAYTISQAITRYFAFLGMYLLLKDHFIKEKNGAPIRVGVALVFALTPFWPSGMLSTLGMPLALWAFLNIRKGISFWKNVLVFTLLPLYSSIVLGFFFFLSAMGIFWLVDSIRSRRWNLRLFFSILYMTTIYFIVEYRLVYSFLFEKELNSRDEYVHAHLSFSHVLRLIMKNYLMGHNHVMTVHGIIIFPITLLALFFVIKNRLWQREKVFVALFVLNFVLSAWYAFWFYQGWTPILNQFHFMNTFNFARYHFLRPMVIYLGFALGLKILLELNKGWRPFVYFFLTCQLALLGLFNDEIIYHKKPTVKEFFAEEQFQDIKKYINKPVENYRVVSIGIHPAIAQYNGFYTLDTYNNFYPLSYKHEFRRIIEKELAKNKTIRKYFDQWGGRCYIFTAQQGKSYMVKKDSKKKLKNLQLNLAPFKKMGGEYVISALPIKNAKENELELDKVFQSKSSAWKIYLYRVI